MIYMTFLGVFWACFLSFSCIKGPKHPLQKSYRSYFSRAQIGWVIWRSSIFVHQWYFPKLPFYNESRAKKAHKLFSHKLSVPPFVPGIVPGTNRVCPRDKPGEIGLPLCRIRRIPGFVPVFHRICPRDKLGLSLGQIRWKLGPTGQKSLCLCAFFLPEWGPLAAACSLSNLVTAKKCDSPLLKLTCPLNCIFRNWGFPPVYGFGLAMGQNS